MRHTTISQHSGTHYTVGAAVWIIAAFWIVAGIVAVMALGGGLTRLAVVLAMVTTEWWLVSKIEDRFEGNAAQSGAKMTPVTHLRPELTGQRDLNRTSAHASWRGPSAA